MLIYVAYYTVTNEIYIFCFLSEFHKSCNNNNNNDNPSFSISLSVILARASYVSPARRSSTGKGPPEWKEHHQLKTEPVTNAIFI